MRGAPPPGKLTETQTPVEPDTSIELTGDDAPRNRVA